MNSLEEVRALKRRWVNLMLARPLSVNLAPHDEYGWVLRVYLMHEPLGDIPAEVDGIPLVVDYDDKEEKTT